RAVNRRCVLSRQPGWRSATSRTLRPFLTMGVARRRREECETRGQVAGPALLTSGAPGNRNLYLSRTKVRVPDRKLHLKVRGKEEAFGTISRPGLPAVSARGHEAVFEGRALSQ